MNANLQDAELLIAMGDSNMSLTTEEVEPSFQPSRRNSSASAVCYMESTQGQTPPPTSTTTTTPAATSPLPIEGDSVPLTDDAAALAPATRAEDESDSTPRSEVPSLSDAVYESLHRFPGGDAEPSYFSPQPLRIVSTQIPQSNTSSDTSPTNVDPSRAPLYALEAATHTAGPSPAPGEPADRSAHQHDISNMMTASVASVRANSLDALHMSTPPPRLKDYPHYPNQSYAALQAQQYPTPPNASHILRAKSSHPAHHSGYSVSHISTFGHPGEHFRDVMDSGSRTVGNSPASSPGLFNPNDQQYGRTPQSEENLSSTPWLHYTHRQAPKETHVADVDVDPVSGRKLVNHYEVIGELGRGVHGKVKLGRNLETGEQVAIKIINRFSKRRRLGKNTTHEDKIKREIAILKKARHPNIVGLLEVIDDPSKKKVYIILEHVRLGEVHWRLEGAKEVCLVEWRRYQRESEGIFDNESAAQEDERIIRRAHQKLERQQRRWAREQRQRRLHSDGNEPWSLELGGESEGDFSDADYASQASASGHERPPSRLQNPNYCSGNMETAFRSSTPTATNRSEDLDVSTGLEGTMYGAYDTEAFRARTPSLPGSNSSHFVDVDEEVPEHFRYVPLMTIEKARAAFRDTVLGLEYLHHYKIIHRDIKPANLLVTEDLRVKISDFGVSYLGGRTVQDSNGDQSESDVQDVDDSVELAKTVGTPAFYAPELCHTDLEVDSPKIGPEIDIWALGITLYCLIYGRVPFHDHNQWLLMKHITDDPPYISNYRLKPVEDHPNSRPNSQGRMHHSITSTKRAPYDLEYEEVSEDLRDLLHRLLIKDPRQRISIPEIKQHPWLTQDIENITSWVEETDPGRSSQGRKIEISKEDIEKAVVPMASILDRVRHGFRKVGELTSRLTRQGSRKRAQSSASGQDTPHGGSANSSSSTISQDSRRPSLGPSMYIYEALSKSRESEHPLSQSVTASPEASERPRYFESPNSRTASPAHSTESREHPGPLGLTSRPQLPDRAYSTLSSAASIRTVRQSDLSSRSGPASPGIPLALPGTPTALDSPSGSNLGGIFGGMPKRAVHNARSMERVLKPPREHGRAKSIDRLATAGDDPHAVPSLAISTTVASGTVDQPDLLKDLSPTLIRGSSPNFPDFQLPTPTERASSRQSSVSSLSSRLRQSWTAHTHELETGPTLDMPGPTYAPLARNASDERFSRAKDEFVRRRVREENINRERPRSSTFQRPPSALSQTACPPSPDDETFYQHQKVEDFLNLQRQPLHDISSISDPAIASTQQRTMTSSSSEDQFCSMSQSTSNPSIPSVASANSSVTTDDCSRREPFQGMVPTVSVESIHINQFDAPMDDPAGYDGDHAIDSEDEESDEEDFLVMSKRKPTQTSTRSESISNAELARSTIRNEISNHRRSARSGSNGTVKKISPPDAEQSSETQ